MDIAAYLKDVLKDKNLNFSKFSELLGQAQSNLANKIKRGTFYSSDLEKMADALNAELEIRFIDRETRRPLGIAVEEKQGDNLTETERLQRTLAETNALLRQILGRTNKPI